VVEGGLLNLTAPDAAQITSVSFTDPTECGLVDGTISMTATGGTGSLVYVLNDGVNPEVTNTSGNFANLDGGNYNLSVRNGDGTCQVYYQSQVTLTQKVAPSVASITPINITDCNETNGTITVNATGSGALEYGIDGVYQTGNVFANLTAGTYNITVRNADGTCTTTAVATTITAPTAPTAHRI